MDEAAKRVLLIEQHPLTAETLEKTLTEQGYEAETVGRPSSVVAEVRERSPDVVALDLPRDAARAGRVLDDLRADPIAGQVPVVAMSNDGPIADAACASFNVQATIAKPLDLADFLAKVQLALGHRPLHADIAPGAPTDALRAQAERILAERSRGALLRFADRLRDDPSWDGTDGMALPELLDGVPGIMEAIDASLHYDTPEAMIENHPSVAGRLREHGEERREQGMPLLAVIREYAMLRDELWLLLKEHLPSDVTGAEVFELERAINGALDRVVETSLPAYVEQSGTL